MESHLLCAVASCRRGPVAEQVSRRMREFAAKGKASADVIFQEMCFCILTANYTSEGGIRIQKAIGRGFIALTESKLAARLRSLGYRFPNARARYIVAARPFRGEVHALLRSDASSCAMRDYLARNVLGLGYKEASHFLRNSGRNDLAIIDFHVVDVLVRHGVIGQPRKGSLSRARYLEIESALATLAKKAGLSQGELDLYLWYLETGKILK